MDKFIRQNKYNYFYTVDKVADYIIESSEET